MPCEAFTTTSEGRPGKPQRWLPTAGLLVLAGVLAGCASPRGKLHDEFAELSPARVAVPPPTNGTVWRLDAVTFGGVLQRLVFRPKTYNVLALLQTSLEKELDRKGYVTTSQIPADSDYRQPLPEAAGVPPFDAAVYATIETWSSSDLPPIGAKMRCRFEMYHVPTAALLYEVVTTVRAGGRHDTQPNFLESAVSAAVRRALSSLPPRH